MSVELGTRLDAPIVIGECLDEAATVFARLFEVHGGPRVRITSVRLELSFVLAVVFTLVAARRTQGLVSDDAGHFGLGRFIDPEVLVAHARMPGAWSSLEEAALAFGTRFGGRFGSDAPQ